MHGKYWLYLVIGILALWLTRSSLQIERYSQRVEAGFPFVYLEDQTGGSPLSGIGKIDNSDIFSLNLPAFGGNLLVYGILLLAGGRVVQSLYTRRVYPSLHYLIPLAGIAGMFLVAASVGYRPLPPVRVPTRTPVPEHVTALIRYWYGKDATTTRSIELQFENRNVTLRTSEGVLRGSYEWLTPTLISMGFESYTVVGAVEAFPCPELPTLLIAACQRRIVSGYPAPLAATAVSPSPAIGAYPAPVPTTVYTDAVYQWIEGNFQVTVNRTHLTLTAPTGEVQTFVVEP